MANSSLPVPHSLYVHGTSATNGGQSFAGVNLGTVNYANSGNDTSVEEVLNSLPTAKDAPFNAYHRQHDPTCLHATRVDLLQEIHDWGEGEDSPGIFWLSGLAGTGKSTIAKTVAVDYNAKGRLAASFFFSRAGGDVNHAGKFITSVSYQLAKTIPDLKAKICNAISKHKDIASQSLNDQWQELVLGPLSSLQDENHRSKFVIVIDALDECDDQKNVQIIVQSLAELQSLQGIRLRVLLTSRPEVPIQYGFTQVQTDGHQDFVLHDIKPAIIEHDISVFLRHRLKLIGRKCGLKNSWPEERAIASLVQNSGGFFIWAATACRFIEEDSQLAETRLDMLVQECNSMLPPERKLDEIYTTVLANSVRAVYTDEESQILHERFRQVVGPIIILQNPLSIVGLAELLGKDVETLRKALATLSSVLVVSSDETNAIRLLHPSFRDFLLNPRRCSNPQFHIDERLVHCDMYKFCLHVMSKHLRRDICNLRHPGAHVSNWSTAKVDQHIPLYLQYASRFWVYHYQRSEKDANNCCYIEEFFQKNFLHWLETLALLGCVSDAVSMVHILDAMYPRQVDSDIYSRFRDKFKSSFLSRFTPKNNRTPVAPSGTGRFTLQDIVHNATRFVLTFRPVLEEAPLQVYYAGIMFCPNASIIKKTFLSELDAWLPSIPEMAENWSPCLQTLKGHSDMVTAVVFSPDGITLASASWDKTIRLWDASSGKALQTLKGHLDTVTTVVFSPDSIALASASRDKIIRLWDASLGKALQTLKGHSDMVTAVVFSPDSITLASASRDKTIRLWDASSGKALQTLKGHSDMVTAVVFSPDGTTLASAAWDATVKLWDASSGKMQTHQNERYKLSAMAFSPDGKILAVTKASTLELWDAASGKAMQTLKQTHNGCSYQITAVAFSPDSKTLALASGPFLVKLWDTSSGKALQKLKRRYGDEVTAMAFSPDGKTLALAASYRVELWDTGLSKELHTLDSYPYQMSSLAFSPDSKIIASASWDSAVKLWDVSSGEELQTLQASSYVERLSFSDRGTCLWTDKGELLTSNLPRNRVLSQPKPQPLITVREEWVYWKGQKVLWVPSEYRPRDFAVNGRRVTFAYYSGFILIFELDFENYFT